MKAGLGGFLVVAQLVAAPLAHCQTTALATPERPPSAVASNCAAAPVVANSLTNPAIVVHPRNLEFPSVGVGGSTRCSFTVQNAGAGTLTGVARASGAFRIVGSGSYTLGRSQSCVIKVEYAPKKAGLDVAVVRLTGGSGATITVAGSSVPAPAASPTRPARPAPPQGLRLLASQ